MLCRSVTPDAARGAARLIFPCLLRLRCAPHEDCVRVSAQEQHFSTLVAKQRRRGLSRLRFTRFVEEQFRQHYAELNYPKARPLLVLAALATCVITGIGMAEHNVSAVTATFGLAVMMPLLMATLIASYQTRAAHLYQPLLAASVLCVGLIVTSRDPAGQPARHALLFCGRGGLDLHRLADPRAAVLVRGQHGADHLRRLRLGARCTGISGSHEALFEMFMLVGVNAIGALCCFQLEATTRQAFRRQAHARGPGGARRPDGLLQPPGLQRLHGADLAPVAARAEPADGDADRHRSLQGVQRPLWPPGGRRRAQARRGSHRHGRAAAAGFRGALRRRGVCPGALRAGERLRPGSARAHPPASRGAGASPTPSPPRARASRSASAWPS